MSCDVLILCGWRGNWLPSYDSSQCRGCLNVVFFVMKSFYKNLSCYDIQLLAITQCFYILKTIKWQLLLKCNSVILCKIMSILNYFEPSKRNLLFYSFFPSYVYLKLPWCIPACTTIYRMYSSQWTCLIKWNAAWLEAQLRTNLGFNVLVKLSRLSTKGNIKKLKMKIGSTKTTQILSQRLTLKPSKEKALWRNRPLATTGSRNLSTVGIRSRWWSWGRSVPVSCGRLQGGCLVEVCLLSPASCPPKCSIVLKGKMKNSHYDYTQHSDLCNMTSIIVFPEGDRNPT